MSFFGIQAQKNTSFVTPDECGGSIQAAVDTGYPVFINRPIRVSAPVKLPTGARIFGNGAAAEVSASANINIFSVEGTDIIIEGVWIRGNGAGAQNGISIVGNGAFTLARYNIHIRDCSIFSCANAGIYATNIVGSASGTKHEGGIYVVNCYASLCGTGFYMDTRGEYSVFTSCVAVNCITNGVRFNGGNNSFIGGQITDNPTGIFIGSGTNDGHGVVIGCKINHNTTNVQSTSTANGFTFVGCYMWAGNITLTTTTGIEFHNCDFSTLTISANTSPGTVFWNCTFWTTPTVSLTSTTLITNNNRFVLGTIPIQFVNSFNSAMIVDSDISPSALSANTDNYAPTNIEIAATLRISASSAVDLTGIAGGITMVDGRELTVINVGTTNTITLKNDVTSTAANRFLLNADFALAANMATVLKYDGTSSRWRKVY